MVGEEAKVLDDEMKVLNERKDLLKIKRNEDRVGMVR